MTITRRDLLAHGGKGIAAAVMLPFLPTTAQAQEDAGLFALFAKYKRLEKVEIEASDRLHHALSEVGLNVSKSFLTTTELIRRCYSARAKEFERAGIPALEKKHTAAVKASLDVLSRLYDVRATTPEGMILKLAIERTDGLRRNWRRLRSAGEVGYHPTEKYQRLYATSSSVEMDIDRLLSGRRI